ncbi:hypothetical protein GE09DRAFT_1164933 [Coniochaeta sp. 2T2.1]|nr:hypothetical protein GE09DRAFT_1164933 [Coniochaeta sp. 2T2.1]
MPPDTGNSVNLRPRKIQPDTVKVKYSWLLLIGFLLFPRHFTTLNKAGVLGKVDTGRLVSNTLRQMSFWVAIACLSVGLAGGIWLWCKLKKNYMLLVTKLCLIVLRKLF